MNMKIRNKDNEAYNKEQAQLKNLNEEESSSFEVVYPETPESETSSATGENMENQEIVGPTTPDEAPPTNIGPRTPSDSPPTSSEERQTEVPLQNNNLEIDFGTKEYNDFYQSLPMKSKKMIMELPPRDRLWILKKTKLLKERKIMEEAQQQQEQQSEQQSQNPEPEKKNMLEYSEEKPEEIGTESSDENINVEIKADSNNDTSSSSSLSNTGVKKIVF